MYHNAIQRCVHASAQEHVGIHKYNSVCPWVVTGCSLSSSSCLFYFSIGSYLQISTVLHRSLFFVLVDVKSDILVIASQSETRVSNSMFSLSEYLSRIIDSFHEGSISTKSQLNYSWLYLFLPLMIRYHNHKNVTVSQTVCKHKPIHYDTFSFVVSQWTKSQFPSCIMKHT